LRAARRKGDVGRVSDHDFDLSCPRCAAWLARDQEECGRCHLALPLASVESEVEALKQFRSKLGEKPSLPRALGVPTVISGLLGVVGALGKALDSAGQVDGAALVVGLIAGGVPWCLAAPYRIAVWAHRLSSWRASQTWGTEHDDDQRESIVVHLNELWMTTKRLVVDQRTIPLSSIEGSWVRRRRFVWLSPAVLGLLVAWVLVTGVMDHSMTDPQALLAGVFALTVLVPLQIFSGERNALIVRTHTGRTVVHAGPGGTEEALLEVLRRHLPRSTSSPDVADGGDSPDRIAPVGTPREAAQLIGGALLLRPAAFERIGGQALPLHVAASGLLAALVAFWISLGLGAVALLAATFLVVALLGFAMGRVIFGSSTSFRGSLALWSVSVFPLVLSLNPIGGVIAIAWSWALALSAIRSGYQLAGWRETVEFACLVGAAALVSALTLAVLGAVAWSALR
jgi:hypothetical protein